MIRSEAPVRSDSFRPVLGATVLLLFALLAMAALKSSRDLEAARARENSLRTKIDVTRGEIERLRVRIDRLHNDPGMLEKLAREDLGMVRPNDVVIELPDPGEGGKAVPRPIPQVIPAVRSAAPAPPEPAAAPVPASGPPAPR